MKTTAIIAEYNPFHNGHKYQLDKIREQTDTDYIIVIISGEFTQRGIPAICNKETRTRIALENGADVVIELPVLFSTGSAEIFARGSVDILDKLNTVDYLVYGTEKLEDTNIFNQALSVLIDEPVKYKEILHKNLSTGLSYPAAVENSLSSYLNTNSYNLRNLFLPNNLLALEYEKQLCKINSSIKGKSINRYGRGYSDNSLDGNFVSASALRNYIKDNQNICSDLNLDKYMPKKASRIFLDYIQKFTPMFEDDFSYILYSMLLTKIIDCDNRYLDCNETIINKIKKNTGNFYSYSQFISTLKSKDFTYNRISRCLCHIMLDIREELFNLYNENDDCLYARLLGFRDSALPLLKKIKENSSIPVVSKTSDADKILCKNALALFNQSINASNLYHGAVRIKSGVQTCSEYQYSVVKHTNS